MSKYTKNYKIITNMKKNSFSEAMTQSLPIINLKNKTIGKLVPVGKWILSDDKKIKNLTQWKKKYIKCFFSQYKPTIERTFWYLNNFSIKKNNRIFFLIFTNKNEFIGHIGLAGIEKRIATLDNLIRGVSKGNSKLIHFSIFTILDWFFKNFETKKISGKIISYNSVSVSLLKKIGFRIKEKTPLKKIKEINYIKINKNNKVKIEGINHIDTNLSDSNVKYVSIKILLDKNEFYKKNI